jgi:hypothetical protein
MKYRDIEYTIVQGIERGVWKWTASVAGVVIMGQAGIKSEAVAAAKKAIDRALASKRGGLSRCLDAGSEAVLLQRHFRATEILGGRHERRLSV